MKVLPLFALTLAVGLGSYSIAADETPAETPAKPAKVAKTPRLYGVWAKMGSLTPEQKQQIGAIHKKALADKKEIDAKEQSDIVALLTPEQKAEMEKITDEATAAKKTSKTSGAAKAGEAETPATQPAEGGM